MDADVEVAAAVVEVVGMFGIFPFARPEREEDEEEKGCWARASRSWVWVGGGIFIRNGKQLGVDVRVDVDDG